MGAAEAHAANFISFRARPNVEGFPPQKEIVDHGVV
jgi:hypothetical protein